MRHVDVVNDPSEGAGAPRRDPERTEKSLRWGERGAQPARDGSPSEAWFPLWGMN